ncbi:hypothetical protein ACLXNF_12320, partial [Mycobacteroides chelonae]|uniref:hypothetical protein n=1 Tax=Mycobacteroides chelonae TaxID=1774 RepID=UPI0039ED2634
PHLAFCYRQTRDSYVMTGDTPEKTWCEIDIRRLHRLKATEAAALVACAPSTMWGLNVAERLNTNQDEVSFFADFIPTPMLPAILTQVVAGLTVFFTLSARREILIGARIENQSDPDRHERARIERDWRFRLAWGMVAAFWMCVLVFTSMYPVWHWSYFPLAAIAVTAILTAVRSWGDASWAYPVPSLGSGTNGPGYTRPR